jgi:hypothetical protein
MDRRTAMQWMLAATAATTASSSCETSLSAAETASTPITTKGYGRDPVMVQIYKPGDVWTLTLTEAQRRITKSLCDIIVPANQGAPSASAVGVPDFLDEWISAPYLEQTADRPLLLNGFEWIEAESRRLFQASFDELDNARQTRVCENFADPSQAAKIHPNAAKFFKRFRDLAFGGYVTTAEGMKALGYVGNIPTTTFEGPPPEALHHLGLA